MIGQGGISFSQLKNQLITNTINIIISSNYTIVDVCATRPCQVEASMSVTCVRVGAERESAVRLVSVLSVQEITASVLLGSDWVCARAQCV